MTTDVSGSDIARGTEVKWYAGGVATTETITIEAGDVTANGHALSGKADYGSVIGTVDGVATPIIECLTDKTAMASETGGCSFVTYAGITEGDVLVVYYIAVGVTALTHVASCQDVKCTSKADTKKAAVHGQPNKLSTVGAVENSADMAELYYNQAFVGLCLGDIISGSPTTGMTKWTNKTSGMHKIGALVGKRVDSAGTVTYKWFLTGAQANEVSGDFPTEDFYKRSMKFDVDYWAEANLVAA